MIVGRAGFKGSKFLARVDVAESGSVIVERDFHCLQRRIPRVDFAAATGKKRRETGQQSSAAQAKHGVRLFAGFRDGEIGAVLLQRG